MEDLFSYSVHTIGRILNGNSCVEIVSASNPDDKYVIEGTNIEERCWRK